MFKTSKMRSAILVVLASLAASPAWAGQTVGPDPHAVSPSDSSDGNCGCNKGMPVYSFKSMLASLNIVDTPVGYAPPVGPKIETSFTYNERETNQPAVFDSFNIGHKWTLNWLTWIQDDPTSVGNQVLRYVAGGGAVPYNGYNGSTQSFTPESDNGAVLVMTSSNPVTYELRFADGSKNVFAASDGLASYPRKVFLTKIVDAQGNTAALSYDSQHRLTSITDAIGQITTFHYTNSSNPLLVTGVTDPFGRNSTLTYDASQRLASITDVAGMTSSFTYDSGTFVTSMTTPYGTTTFAHTEGANGNSSELSIQATDPNGKTERTEFLHAAPGIPFSESQVPSGMGTFDAFINYRDSYYWNKNAFASACTIVNGRTTCDYTQARIKHFLHLGPQFELTARVIESTKRPLENRTWYDYPNQGWAGGTSLNMLNMPLHIGRVINGSTQLTTFAYNALGLVTSKTDPDGRTTIYTYDPGNQIDLLQVQQKTATGMDTIAQYTYNTQHEPLTYTDAAGQKTTFAYNARGQRIAMTDALGDVTTYVYNSSGYLSKVIDALGHAQYTFTYDSVGRVATDTDSEGYTTHYAYDNLDRVTLISYPDGTTRKFAWAKLDIASETDRQGNTTRYDYDVNRNPVQRTDPLGRITRYSYYPNGGLQTLTDPGGNVTTWTRDLENRVTAKAYASGGGTSYGYDVLGRLSSTTDALGQTQLYSYDLGNLVTGTTYQNPVNPTAPVSYNYSPVYPRLVGMTDGLGATVFNYVPVGSPGALRLAAVDGPYNHDVVQYAYDKLGRVKQRTTDQNDSFVYDAIGRLTRETNPLGRFDVRYLGDTNQPTNQSLTTAAGRPGLSMTVQYDDNSGDRQLHELIYRKASSGHQDHGGQPSGRRRENSGQPFEQLTYTHSPEHLVTSLDALTQNHTGGKSKQQYDYDAAYRLTGVRPPEGRRENEDGQDDMMHNRPHGYRAEYSYDDADNLIHYATPDAQFTATANDLDQLTTVNGISRKYDADGNLVNDGTNQYAWDAQGRLIAVTKLSDGHITSFKYDGLGRRLAIDEQNAGATPIETRYLWCGSDVCQARNSADAVTADYYTEGELRGNQALYYIRDQLGSVVDVTDAKGTIQGSAHFGAYGATESASGITPAFGYAGMLHNTATGLYLTQYRAYDPITGRWLSRDPIGIAGGINPYTYVGGNPLSYVDPLGLSTIVYKNNTITLTNNNGQPVGTFPAYNNTTNPATDPNSAGPYPAGTYPYAGYAPKPSDPNGPFGSNGAFHFPHSGCPGCEIHSGRANKGGPKHKTQGCIRTTDQGTKAINDLIKNGDPPTTLTVIK